MREPVVRAPHGRDGRRPLLVARHLSDPAAVLALALAGAFAALSVAVQAGWLDRLDRAITDAAVDHRTGWLTVVMRGITAVGSTALLLPIAVAGGLARWRRTESRRSALTTIALAYAGAVALYDLGKVAFGRGRPQVGDLIFTATGYSYPSGHATQSIAVLGSLVVVLTVGWRPARARVAAGAVALLLVAIGASRVYLGVHWASDVAGGWLLGGAWLAAVVALVGRARPAPVR